jgi:RNA polymerase sigma-70 factor (ECF subfamily)
MNALRFFSQAPAWAPVYTVPHNARMSAQPDDLLMDLIDRVAQRDEAALKSLYDTTSPKLYGLAMRVVGKSEWAEDAL